MYAGTVLQELFRPVVMTISTVKWKHIANYFLRYNIGLVNQHNFAMLSKLSGFEAVSLIKLVNIHSRLTNNS